MVHRARQLRVMFALSHTEPAGAQQLWADLASGFRERGHEDSLAALYPHPKGTLELPDGLRWDYALDRPGKGAANGLRAVRGAMHIIRATRADIVFTALPAANVIFTIANLLLRQPARLFVSHHSPVETHSRVLNQIDSMVARASSVRGIICVSEAVRTSIAGKSPAYQAKALVIKNALPPWVEHHVSKLNRDALAHGAQRRRIVASGRLAPQKNLAVLIRALAALPDATLDIVGGGPDEAEFRALIAQLAIGDRVTLLGPRSRAETLALVAGSDVFAQPSLFEGHSLALIEAAKLGLPLVVSDVPSQVEGVTRRDGTCCALIHSVNDHVGLAQALSRLLTDPATYEAYRGLAVTLGAESRFIDMLDHYEALALGRRNTTLN